MKQEENAWKYVSMFLGVLLIASFVINAIVILGADKGTVAAPTGQVVVPTQPTAPSAPTAAPTANLQIGNSPTIGNKDAEVVVVEFSDFECPFCGRFYSDSYVNIKKDYIDTGKVFFVFKQFPLSFHPNAQKAAEASLCAAEQGKFSEYHDKLFTSQQSLSVASLKQYADDMGLDSGDFNDCLDTGKYAAQVSAETAEGAAAGVSGTPTIFVDGQKIVGAQPYATFKAAIDAALAG